MPKGRPHYRNRLEDALEAHDSALEHGGHPGILNLSSVRSAIGRPYTGYCRQIWKKGAALFESACRNHGFTDGNKRTAVILLLLLLDRSGFDLQPIPREDINDAIENLAVVVADGQMDIQAIESWLQTRVVVA